MTSHLQVLDAARWELIALDFSLAHTFSSYNAMVRVANREEKDGMVESIINSGKTWPQPYAQLLEAVESARRKGQAASSIPDRFYEELREAVESKKDALQCTLPDFQAISASYKLELTEVEKSIEAESEGAIKKIQDEYAAKGERVRITDEFRRATRASVRAGSLFKLDSGFRKKIEAYRKECDGKAVKLIDDFRKSKGLRH